MCTMDHRLWDLKPCCANAWCAARVLVGSVAAVGGVAARPVMAVVGRKADITHPANQN